MGKVPPTHAVKDEAGNSVTAKHNPNLVTEVQDSEGQVRTFFSTHPAGNRVQRRSRQRHHPFFTKDRSPGREWLQAMREHHRAQAEARKEKSEGEKEKA
jgi:hypothetical protein